jgi:hypothetical protein
MAVNRLNVGATNQLLAKASTGQSTNILELQNTAGVTVAGVDASGNGVGGLAHPPTFKNLIINGAMQVAQRGTSVTGVTAGDTVRTADRWIVNPSSLGTWTSSVEDDAPTGSGFRKSSKVLCTTADASPSANDLLVFQQRIEGQNLQQIAKGTSSAKELSLSFWVKANVTGTYIVELYDGTNTRQVSKSYTVNASATWEKKTITIPADTTGAFANDNTTALSLIFWLGAGSAFTSGTLNTSWASVTNANRVVGGTNLAAATNNYWQITGVQLEVGSVATDYEFKPADVELEQCQRYYWKTGGNNVFENIVLGFASTTTNVACLIPFPVYMRTTPSSVAYSNLQFVVPALAEYTISAMTLSGSESGTRAALVDMTSSGLTQFRNYYLRTANSTSGYIAFSAEL